MSREGGRLAVQRARAKNEGNWLDVAGRDGANARTLVTFG